MRARIQRYPVTTFFGIVFLMTWAVWGPMALTGSQTALFRLGTFSPLLAGLALTAALEGVPGLRSLLRRFLRWRVPLVWTLFSLFSTAGVVGLALMVDWLLGGPAPKLELAMLVYFLPITAYVLVTSVLGEETGWRGFALPRLLRRYGPLRASLLLGLVWGLWHLPLFWMEGDFHRAIPIPLFLIQSIALSLLYTWIHQRTQGSLWLAHLFHAASNATLGILPILPFATGSRVRPLWIAVGLLCLLALISVRALRSCGGAVRRKPNGSDASGWGENAEHSRG